MVAVLWPRQGVIVACLWLIAPGLASDIASRKLRREDARYQVLRHDDVTRCSPWCEVDRSVHEPPCSRRSEKYVVPLRSGGATRACDASAASMEVTRVRRVSDEEASPPQ